MEETLGTTLPVFIAMTVIFGGFAAYMTGQAIANTWRPVFQVIFYCCLLAMACRFLIWGLFQGELLTLSGYLMDVLILQIIGLVSFRRTQVKKMISQYPWLYMKNGPFFWKDIEEHHP